MSRTQSTKTFTATPSIVVGEKPKPLAPKLSNKKVNKENCFVTLGSKLSKISPSSSIQKPISQKNLPQPSEGLSLALEILAKVSSSQSGASQLGYNQSQERSGGQQQVTCALIY